MARASTLLSSPAGICNRSEAKQIDQLDQAEIVVQHMVGGVDQKVYPEHIAVHEPGRSPHQMPDLGGCPNLLGEIDALLADPLHAVRMDFDRTRVVGMLAIAIHDQPVSRFRELGVLPSGENFLVTQFGQQAFSLSKSLCASNRSRSFIGRSAMSS